MNNDTGYALIPRRLLDLDIFKNDQEAAVFILMIARANWRDATFTPNFGKPFVLHRGEVIIAERRLSESFNLHRNTIRRLLSVLEETGLVTLVRDRTDHRNGTVARIEKYEEYQCFAGENKREQDHTGTVSQPYQDRTGTDSNTKNTNNEGSKEREAVVRLVVSNEAAHSAASPLPEAQPVTTNVVSMAASGLRTECRPEASSPTPPERQAANQPGEQLALLGDTEAKPARKKREAKPATRIPDDWKLSDEGWNYARSKGLDPNRIDIESEKFYNHWKGTAKNPTKSDWGATWRTWVLRAIENNGVAYSSRNGDKNVGFARTFNSNAHERRSGMAQGLDDERWDKPSSWLESRAAGPC